MNLVLALIAITALALASAAHQQVVNRSQRRLMAAMQSLTSTMTPTQMTRDVADTLNRGNDIMATVGHRGVTVGLVSDKNTRYGPSEADHQSDHEPISLFEECDGS